MENNEIIEQETALESNLQSVSETAKPKSNKKKVIILAAVAAVVVIGIVATVIAIVSNSNSLWKEPFDEESFCYGYCVTPQEFVEKANEILIDGDLSFYRFTYENKSELTDTSVSAERYIYSINLNSDIKLTPAYAGIDYYSDNTIRQIVVSVPYTELVDHDAALHQTACYAVQLLYAYDEFGENVSNEKLNSLVDGFYETFLSGSMRSAFSNSTSSLYKYNDFVITLSESDDGEYLYMGIEKTDIEKFQNENGITLISLTENDSTYENKSTEIN